MPLNREEKVPVCIHSCTLQLKSQYTIELLMQHAYLFHILLHCPSHLTNKTDLFSAHVNGMEWNGTRHFSFFSESQRVPIIWCSCVFKWNPLFSDSAIRDVVVGGTLKVIIQPKIIICWNCTQHQAIQDCCFVRPDLEKLYTLIYIKH